jgi:phosphoglycolate phosphatase-like HAD superfamily hydrolase
VTIHEGDAPQSPEPAFLRLAMRSLGVERAWVLSAREEDVIAGRTGGLTPIGIARDEPGGAVLSGAGVPACPSAGVPARRLLEQAGAARIVTSPSEILEWLS